MTSGIIDENDKSTFYCKCTNSVFITKDTAILEFPWPGHPPRAGQFFLIKPRRTGVFLGRPISVAGWFPSLEAAGSGTVRFIVAQRGRGSWELTDMKAGEEAELIGPLGNCWKIADIPQGPVALVGGGIGIAPLLALIPELGDRVFDFYAGFRSGSFGLENMESKAPRLRSLIIAAEDGSAGKSGRIPDYFTPTGYSGVFACGPEPMLKVISEACAAWKVPCFISMERHMACGVGACLGCTVKTTGGNRRCCADGPVFNASEVLFNE